MSYLLFLVFKRSISIEQEISDDVISNGRCGNITNIVTWPEWNGESDYCGELRITSNYTLTPQGDIEMELQSHVLKAEREVPADVEDLVGALQGAIPFDLFDPTDLFIRHTVS